MTNKVVAFKLPRPCHDVVSFAKERFPFHVCGVSMPRVPFWCETIRWICSQRGRRQRREFGEVHVGASHQRLKQQADQGRKTVEDRILGPRFLFFKGQPTKRTPKLRGCWSIFVSFSGVSLHSNIGGCKFDFATLVIRRDFKKQTGLCWILRSHCVLASQRFWHCPLQAWLR